MTANGTVRAWQILALIEGLGIVVLLVLLLGGGEAQHVRSGGERVDEESSGSARAGALDGGPERETPSSGGIVVRDEAPARGSESEESGAKLGIVLHGRVTGDDGEPLEAYVTLDDEVEGRLTASCNEAGQYAIPGLSPGSYACTVGGTGFRTRKSELELHAGDRLVRKDFVLESSHLVKVRIELLDGRELTRALEGDLRRLVNGPLAVTATPRPVAGDLPEIDHRSYQYTVHSIWETWGGLRFRDFDLERRYSGILELRTPAPAHAHLMYRHMVLQSRLIHPGQKELTFRVGLKEFENRFGRVRVEVVDGHTGEPVPDARVSLGTPQGFSGHVELDGDGWGEARCTPGNLEMTVVAEGYGAVRRHVEVPAGGMTDAGRIEMYPETRIAGRVVGPDDEGIGGAGVSVLRIEAGDGLREPARVAHTTDADGAFDYHFYVGRGLHLVIVRAEGFGRRAVQVDTSAGSVSGVVIPLEKGVDVTVACTSSSGNRYQCWLQDAQGQLLARSIPSGRPRQIPLAPGRYRLLVTLGGQVVHSEYFTAGSEPKRVEMELP